MREANVILIIASDVRTLRLFDPPIQSMAKSAILLNNHANPIVLKRSNDIARRIGASVIDHEQFEIRKTLRQQRLESFTEIDCPVIHRYNNCHSGRSHRLDDFHQTVRILLPKAQYYSRSLHKIIKQ